MSETETQIDESREWKTEYLTYLGPNDDPDARNYIIAYRNIETGKGYWDRMEFEIFRSRMPATEYQPESKTTPEDVLQWLNSSSTDRSLSQVRRNHLRHLTRNYPSPVYALISYYDPNGLQKDILIFNENYHGGQCWLDLRSGEKYSYDPPVGREHFCWASISNWDPLNNKLEVYGCMWGGHFMYLNFNLNKLLDFPWEDEWVRDHIYTEEDY
jgi:hypothetical protein